MELAAICKEQKQLTKSAHKAKQEQTDLLKLTFSLHQIF